MIQSRDLRVGNLVNIQEPAIHWNGDNFKHTVFEIETIYPKKVYFKGFASYEEYGSLKGIELTEEWLERFGFIEFNEFSIAKTFALVIDGIIKYKIHKGIDLDYFVMPNEYNAIRFNSVHQLQNLFYALRGEELIIKK